MIIDTVAVVA